MNTRKVVRTRDVMEQTFTEVDGLATVAQALEIMRQDRLQVLIVKKRTEVDEYGIVLLADIAKKVLAKDRAPERVNVYEIMSKPVISVDPHMDVRYCARLLDRFGLSVVPVIEDERVIGIVSYSELVFRGL
ncbi:MAG: CBS domain-containing protein [Gammaproteobacteria bacterium]|nr:CBS domain-containing protein [Gammaproteobacteria bacterium]MCP5200313.1 CBS domain-containing protein [Gammaproteobacteria bacterium]